ncbi:MAG: prolyl oligopeptidase family serine peptidase [Ignavibacteria bacterium]
MKKTLLFLMLFMAFLSINLFAQKQIPLRDFFRNPEKANYQLSPDGKHISFLSPYKGRLNIYVKDLLTGTETRITEAKERDITIYFWKGNNKICYLQDIGGDENYKLYIVNIDGSDFKVLTPYEKVVTQIIDDLKDNDNEMLIALNKRNPTVFDVYRINVNTGEMTMIAENPGNITEWQTDHNGKLRVAVATDGVNTSLLYRENESEPFRVVKTTSFKETLSPLFFTFDNKNVYAISNIGRDKAAIIKYDIANDKELELIFEHSEVDVDGLNYSEKRKVLTSITYTTWKRQIKFLDEETEKIYKKFESFIGSKYEIVIVNKDREETKFIARTYSDKSLGTYYLYDKENDAVSKLADISPWLNENDLADMKPIQYTTRDGLTIHGYLTLPKGVEPKNLPVVVNPHGGPWARDRWGFNPEVQFLANRGFAVLQVNFRGSTGYGRKFWELSFKQWGKKMQDDITDGVYWLIKEGIANPKRIAIYGGSYGGYATLGGITFTPDLYAAAVDYVGVSNLFTFMNTIPPYWKPMLEMLYEMVGDPRKDSTLLYEASPVFHVDKIKAPLFVAQGKNDPRVNINESDQIVNALKQKGVDVEYMVKENEGHGFHNEENRFDFYEAMEKFLKKHLMNESIK